MAQINTITAPEGHWLNKGEIWVKTISTYGDASGWVIKTQADKDKWDAEHPQDEPFLPGGGTDNCSMKANIDGYYETMRVGSADNLTPRGDASEEIIMSRTAGGNNAIEAGDALIKSIKGNSLVMNQKIDIGAFRQKSEFGLTFTVESDYVVVDGVATGEAWYNLFPAPIIAGHHYYYYSAKNFFIARISPNRISVAPESNERNTGYFRCSIGESFQSQKFSLNLFDLTQMFGTGNEPSTPEEFAQRLGYDSIEQIPYIPHSDGEIVSCNAEGIRTTDAEGDTYERKWTSTMQKYFPAGLKSAGKIYDEITPTKAVKRIGVVNMNSLGWVTHNEEYKIFRAEIANMAEPADYENRKNGLLSNSYKPSKKVGIGVEMEDSSMLRGFGVIYVKDSRYSDLESFVNHFTENDELYYELATPEEYTYDELNLSMRVAQGGKEEAIIPEGLSTPLKMDVVYPIDAYGTIVANKQHIGSLSSLQTQAKDDLVSAVNELKKDIQELQQQK